MTNQSTDHDPTAPEDDSGADLVERVVDSRVLHRGAFLEFRIDTVERADGTRATRDIAGHPGAVAIVALDADGRVALVRQWRLPADAALLEIPAGGLDVGDDGTKEDPGVAAPRELEEETGLRAATWRALGSFYTAPGFTDELMHLYLATDLSPAAREGRLGPDEDERLILEWRPWRDAVAAAERGEIRDAKSLVGLFWLARLMDASDPAIDSTGVGETVCQVARAQYRMTTADVVRATIVATRGSTGTRVMGLLLIALGLGTILVMNDPGSLFVNLPLIALGASFVTGWFAAPIAWYQARKRPDLVGAETTLTADDRGIHVASSLVNGLNRWETFRSVHERGGFFLLDTNAGLNIIIPLRVFSPADLATFYRLLDRHGLLPGTRRRR